MQTVDGRGVAQLWQEAQGDKENWKRRKHVKLQRRVVAEQADMRLQEGAVEVASERKKMHIYILSRGRVSDAGKAL